MSKAEMLREYRAEMGEWTRREAIELWLMIFGISGNYVRLSDSKAADGSGTIVFLEDGQYIISQPTRELILRLSEVGHLYTRVSAFVQAKDSRASAGLIKQSLCHHLQTQLTEYYRLVAILESQMSTLVPTGADKDNSVGVSGLEDGINTLRAQETGLTLRRLEVWIEEWRLRMRMMSACVEGCKDANGGAFVSLIHCYTDNGDPFVCHFTDQLLEEVSKPFFAILHRWLYSGDMRDPFNEFFVTIDPELADQQYVLANSSLEIEVGAGEGLADLVGGGGDRARRGTGGLRLWQGKYKFRKEMLPRFVEEGFAKKIFSTGKSLNFIRYSCHDSDWIATRNKLTNTNKVLKYSDIAGLEQSIDKAYQIASQRLFDVFFEKFKLLTHLKAVRQYLLLGHGDFAEYLMEALAPNLRARPANVLLRHDLTGTLESAIRSTNAQYDVPDVLRRLDARMMEYSHGEIGWDVFMLEYKVDALIDTVLDPVSMSKYSQLFNYLWKMKRVNTALTTGWMRLTSTSRNYFKVQELQETLHACRLKMAEMIFFMNQLQAFCQSYVIENQWVDLVKFVRKNEGDLDTLIAEHVKYVDNLVGKIFMTGGKAKTADLLHSQVSQVFENILLFREATENLYKICLEESARLDVGKDAARGVFTAGDPNGSSANQEAVNRMKLLVMEYGNKTTSLIKNIALGLVNHHDSDCKGLGQVLHFNDFVGYKKGSGAARAH